MGWKKDLRASWRLDPVSGQRLKRRSMSDDIPLGIDLERWGRLVTGFGALHDSLRGVVRWWGRWSGSSRWEGESLRRGEVACRLAWKAYATPRHAVPSPARRGKDSFQVEVVARSRRRWRSSESSRVILTLTRYQQPWSIPLYLI